jgi:hypothetical protein
VVLFACEWIPAMEAFVESAMGTTPPWRYEFKSRDAAAAPIAGIGSQAKSTTAKLENFRTKTNFSKRIKMLRGG